MSTPTFREQTRLEELQSYLERHALQFATANDGNVVGLVNMLTFEEEAITDRLVALSDVTHFAGWWEKHRAWLIGDAINLGMNEAGEVFAHHLNDNTLSNWAGVCSRYAHHERIGGLSFTHHAELAYEKDKRRRAELLQLAYDNHLTAAELRALKNAGGGGDSLPSFVRGMKRYDLAEGLELGLINREELSAFIKAGYLTLRVEYTITGEL